MRRAPLAFLRTPVAGALAMFVIEVARSWCRACAPRNVVLAGCVAALAGAAAGLFVSLMHRRVRSLGAPGEYLLGWSASWIALCMLQYFRPFVWDSSFAPWRTAYLGLIAPAAYLGAVITTDLRFRERRLRDYWPGLHGDQRAPWQSIYSLPSQILIASTVLVLGTVAMRAYRAVLYPDIPLEQRVEAWMEWAEGRPSDPEAQYGLTLALLARIVRDPGGAANVFALAPTRTRSNR